MTYINDQVDITTLIQQAIDNGDTATARALSRALENQTRLSVPTQTYIQEPEYQYVEYQQPVTYTRRTSSFSITWWLCFVVLPYLAVAEVLAPGHQGPLKIHKTELAWPIDIVGNVFGGKEDAAP